MNNENEKLEQEIKCDDDDEIVTIKYFDRINHRWIDLEITKKVKRFMQADNKDRKRQQNRYDNRTRPYDEIFDEDKHPGNMKYLIDEEQDPYYILVEKKNRLIEEAKIEENRAMVENSLHILNDTQREVIEKMLYEISPKMILEKNLELSNNQYQEDLQERQKTYEII